jgi:exonuclease SbcD
MLYPGSIERVDFGEERDPKGIVLVTLAKGEAQYEFRRLDARRFLSIEIEADGEEPLQQVLDVIARHDVAGAIVRVLIHTSADKEGRIPYSEVRKALKDAYCIAAISKKVLREDRFRLGSRLAEAISPEEALRLYLKGKQVPEERQKLLLQYADALIRAAP